MQFEQVFAQQIKLTWLKNPEADVRHYNIYRSINSNSNFQKIAEVAHPDTTYVDSDAAHGTNYYYKISAEDSAGNVSVDSDQAYLPVPGLYTLNISVEPSAAGNVVKSPDKTQYEENEQVTLSVNANSGYIFDNWDGDITGNNSTITITMDGNKTITAYFSQLQYTLNLTMLPSEGGTVIKNPDKTSYSYDEQVELTINTNLGYTFDHWSGDANGNDSTLTITIDGDKNIIANFNQLQYALNLTLIPTDGGSVTKEPDKVNYTYGENVTLSVSENAGFNFDHWFGDISGNELSVNVLMDGSKNISAHFNQTEYTINIITNPQGKGSVTKNPDKPTYNYGEQVSLTVIVDGLSGYAFDQWSGDVTGTEETISIIIDDNKTISALFENISPSKPKDLQLILK